MSERIIGIPEDWVVIQEFVDQADPPPVWSIPASLFKPVWELGITGKGVRVGVTDTGFTPHSNIKNPVAARNFTSSGSPDSVVDRNGHGTHCAGTILGTGGIGVAPEAELVVAKVLDDSGSGSTTWINKGLVYCAEQGCHITSRSLGGPGGDQEDRVEIEKAYEKGLLIDVCAAGNSGYSGNGSSIGYPAAYDMGICVGAYQEDGKIANFSSGGKSMDVAAPGKNIVSARAGGGFATMSGTSMATPHFAGLLALMIQKMWIIGIQPPKGYAAWVEYLRSRGLLEDRGSNGFDPLFGNGVLLVTKIVAYLKDPAWL